MSEVNMEMAKNVFESACAALDAMDIKYKKVEDDLVILFGHRGQDMNHELLLAVNARQEAIQLIERLPFEIEADKARDVACAVCLVNDRILAGSFTFDMESRLSYEVTQLYSGSLIGEETIKRMIIALVITVEEYDDKFMALNKGYVTVDEFKRD